MSTRTLRLGALVLTGMALAACGRSNEGVATDTSSMMAPATPSMAPGSSMDTSMRMDSSMQRDTSRRDTTRRDTMRR